jgi:hypothetical protein
MANLVVIDGAGDVQELKAGGTGATGDPFVQHYEIDASALPAGAATETSAAAAAGGIGAAADAVVAAGAAGSLSAKLRRLTTDLGALLALNEAPGAANVTVSQVTATTSAGTLAVARPTRRSLVVKNTDTAITVYIGPATVTSGNGMPVKAGESLAVSWVGLVQVISASGSPVIALWDEYA